MRKKELRLVVTFHTTSDAMQMEAICKEKGIEGKMIPVPREISAGCGLAFCTLLEKRDTIVSLLQSVGLEQEDIHECEIFV